MANMKTAQQELGVKMAKYIVELEEKDELRKLAERVAKGMSKKGMISPEQILEKRDELMQEKKASLITKEAALDLIKGNSLSMFADCDADELTKSAEYDGHPSSERIIQSAQDRFANNVTKLTLSR